jgi:[ribosomal protein S18]-alanine N-acetyltransferase
MPIRKMELSDLDSVMELETKYQHRPWAKANYGQAMRLEHHCVVVERDGVIVGYGVADKGHGRTIYAKDSRVALELYNDWFENSKEVGAPVMWAETAEGSVDAIAMLVRLGFHRTGTRPAFYGPGADATVWTRPTGLGLTVPGMPELHITQPYVVA